MSARHLLSAARGVYAFSRLVTPVATRQCFRSFSRATCFGSTLVRANPVVGASNWRLGCSATLNRLGLLSLQPEVRTFGTLARLSPSQALSAYPITTSRLVQQYRTLKTVKRQTKRRYRKPSTYKMKRKKAAAARFKIVGNDNIKFWRAGRRHNSQAKSGKRHRLLRRPGYATGAKRKKVLRMLLGYN